MTLLTNNFEGGSNGVAITTGNSGGSSGNAFDLMGTGDIQKFATNPSGSGVVGQFASRANASGAFCQWNTTSHGTTTDEYGRCYFYMTAYPPGTTAFQWLLSQANSALSLNPHIGFTATGGLRVFGDSSTAGSTYSLNTWYRFEWEWYLPGLTFQVISYLGDSTTAIDNIQVAAATTAATACGGADFGMVSSAANVPTSSEFWYVDNLVIGATTWPGPAVVAGPLTNTAFTGFLSRG